MEYFDLRTILPDLKNKNTDVIEFFEDLAREMDGRIPKNLAEMLIEENNNPDYVIKIHRQLASGKQDVFNQGLPIRGGTNLNYTLSDYTGTDLSLLISIRDAYGYKNPFLEDATCIIAKIPKEYLQYEKGKTKPILIPTNIIAEQSGGMAAVEGKYQTVLLPEFILGSVDYSGKRIIGFSRNEKYKDVHDYQPDGLVCTEDVICSYYEKTGTPRLGVEENDIALQEKQEAQINETIIAENKVYEASLKKAQRTCRTENHIKNFSLAQMTRNGFSKAKKMVQNLFHNNTREGSEDIKDDRC